MNLAQTLVRKLPTTIRYPSTISKISICQKSTTQAASSSSSSSSSSDSDDEIKKKKLSSNEAAARLNTLLQEMVTTSNKSFSELKLAKPKNKRAEGRKEKQKQTETVAEPVEKQVANAVKNVAESLGGDIKQTESELLMKLSNPVENSSVSNTSLSDILKGMKIEREVKPPQQSRAEQVRTALNKISTGSGVVQRRGDNQNQRRSRQPRMPMNVAEGQEPQNVDLFSGEALGIFTNPSDLKESPQIPTWQKLYEKELKLAVTHPPANYFQQVILWTEQGKFWQFPINNEFGLEEESKVYFADHIFLEEHLEPWCPPRGPIRHFMELVCVGLSKNNYLTVQAKKEHIEWFKNYFEEKKQLLQEVGALGDQVKQKSIDKE
ncbi:unnamed protein product [Ceutorhynchus assimilis]|uniref:Small ribosomal subunit protein mS31 n=1 Tax=Ceutorhynchus assimilis TaxID=467358 RepID=A0A9N9QLP5_9CUCU|nr:unnamed protein product [Ceutorhynchus assimilis]